MNPLTSFDLRFAVPFAKSHSFYTNPIFYKRLVFTPHFLVSILIYFFLAVNYIFRHMKVQPGNIVCNRKQVEYSVYHHLRMEFLNSLWRIWGFVEMLVQSTACRSDPSILSIFSSECVNCIYDDVWHSLISFSCIKQVTLHYITFYVVFDFIRSLDYL